MWETPIAHAAIWFQSYPQSPRPRPRPIPTHIHSQSHWHWLLLVESRGPEAFRAPRQGNIGSSRSEGCLIASVVSVGFRLWFLVSGVAFVVAAALSAFMILKYFINWINYAFCGQVRSPVINADQWMRSIKSVNTWISIYMNLSLYTYTWNCYGSYQQVAVRIIWIIMLMSAQWATFSLCRVA